MTAEQLKTCYVNARLLAAQGKAKEARIFILRILNYGLEVYEKTNDIIPKVKTKIFLEKWVKVAQDLRENGVTEYVKSCFGFSEKELPAKSAEKAQTAASPKNKTSESIGADENIDMSDVISGSRRMYETCADIIESNKNCVVEIHSDNSDSLSSGTGFIISNNGYLLTNDHVVFDENSGTYRRKTTMSFSGDNKRYKIEVMFSDKKSDVALCRFNPAEIKSVKSVKRIADFSKVRQAEECLIIGNTFGTGLAPIKGEVRFPKNANGNLVCNALANPGDSGGPVFNMRGECIGINKAKIVAVDGAATVGIAQATPMDTIDALLKKWTEANNITL